VPVKKFENGSIFHEVIKLGVTLFGSVVYKVHGEDGFIERMWKKDQL